MEATVQHYVAPVPWSTYRTYGTAKYWEYDSTLEATVQHYLVHVLLSTYCTHVAIKYWEYDSTLVDATVYYNTTLCLLYKLSMSQLGVMPNTALNVSFYACPLCPLLLLPFH